MDNLRCPHASIPRNPRMAEPLFLARYIEKAGTGTLDMIDLCAQAGLATPAFRQDGGQFVLTLWRPQGGLLGASCLQPHPAAAPSWHQAGTKSESSPKPATARL